MITRFFAFLSLCLIALGADAQDWASPSSVWQYSFTEFYAEGIIRLRHSGDTLINGALYTRLSRKQIWYDWGFETSDSLYLAPFHTRSEGDSVWVWRHGEAQFLYDFGASVGDTWELTGDDSWCEPTGVVQVDSVANIMVDGQMLREIWTSPVGQSHWAFTGPVVEGIGCVGYLLPEPTFECGVADNGVGATLRCYQDTGLFYQTGIVPWCNFLVSVDDQQSSQTRMQVAPNPFSRQLTISRQSAGGSEAATVQIVSLTGRVVFDARYTQFPVTIEPVLPPGAYVLKLMVGEHTTFQKLVKTGSH